MKTVVLLVTGGREFSDRLHLETLLDAVFWDAFRRLGERPTLHLFEGEYRGTDLLARAWAESNGHVVHPFKADWDRHKKRAGPKRNLQMLEAVQAHPADLRYFVQFPGGKGTYHMTGEAVRKPLDFWNGAFVIQSSHEEFAKRAGGWFEGTFQGEPSRFTAYFDLQHGPLCCEWEADLHSFVGSFDHFKPEKPIPDPRTSP